jgi:hypothetical protein
MDFQKGVGKSRHDIRTAGNTTENISRNGGRVKDYFRTNPK